MRFEIREFRIPIVLTILMLMVITYWAWQTWHWLDDPNIGRAQHEAVKISDILITALNALDQNGQLDRNGIEQRFGTILHATDYQFFLLVKDGRRILQIGEIPAGVPTILEKNAFFMDTTFIFSRMIRFPKRNTGVRFQDSNSEIKPLGSVLLDCDYLMVMGRDTRQDHMPTSKFVEHIIIPFIAVLLILCANAGAWVMVLRNRSLFSQLEIERAKAAHLEELGLAAAGLAHETKNPLGIISGIAQQVARDPGIPEKSRDLLETIVDEIDKSVSRLGLFMTFAGHRAVSPVPVDAGQVINGVADIMTPEFDAAGVKLDLAVTDLSIMADEQMFRQILVNLLMNSLTASSPGDSVMIRLTRQGRHAVMEVQDQGCGIPEDLLPRIFKPYVTGNPEGHGLGLAIVKRFAEDLDWRVNAKSEPGQGTVMRISDIAVWDSTGETA